MTRIPFATVLMLFALSLASGCTPEVNQHETDRDYEEALSSYELCRMRYHPVDQGSRCDSVAWRNNGSYQQGSFADPGGSPYSPYTPYSAGSPDLMTRTILASSSEQLDAMKAEWRRLAIEPGSAE